VGASANFQFENMADLFKGLEMIYVYKSNNTLLNIHFSPFLFFKKTYTFQLLQTEKYTLFNIIYFIG